MKKAIIGMGLMFAASQAAALDTSTIYFGGGLGDADVDCTGCGSESEIHLFAGVPLTDLGAGNVSAEVGYYDVDTTPGYNGLTLSALFGLPVADQFSILGRLGADFNSDADLLYFGLGAAYEINSNFDVRFDYTMGETDSPAVDVNTMSLSVVYRP